MTHDTTEDTTDESNEEIELGPFSTAKRVRGSVFIKKRTGNLFEKIFIDEEDWEAIGSLFGRLENTNSTTDESDNYVLEHGGKVRVKYKDFDAHYDRIEFTQSGMVVCYNKDSQLKACYPRENIKYIHTPTSDDENEE